MNCNLYCNGMLRNMMRKVRDLVCMRHTQSRLCHNETKYWKWDIPSLISCSDTNVKYAVIILHRPVTTSHTFMKHFWNNASVTITIDGGTAQWDIFLNKLPEDLRNSMKPPDLVTGDFDSLEANILHKYEMKGCKLIKTPDQNYTDFTKGLMELNKHCIEQDLTIDHVVAIGQTSGRLDHVLGNIQTLFLAKENCLLRPETRLYIVSDDSLSWLLYPGEHSISVPDETRMYKGAWCSLIPLGQECKNITTKGLKWNLDESLRNNSMRFGKLVSTSNAFDGSDTVQIKCSHPVLWSMCIPSLLDQLKGNSKL